MEYTRQHDIFNPEEQKLKIQLIGCGSTGSFIALTLAKMGINNISVYDFDKVEAHNIPNQFYRLQDIGNLKVEALKDIIKDFTGIEISINAVKIEEGNMPLVLDLDTIIILAVDNMEIRKVIYNSIKEYPVKLIDTRMGGEGYQIYNIDLSNENQERIYEACLNAEIVEAPCGQKAIIYTILSIASEVCNLIKRIDKGEIVPQVIKRQMANYKILNNLEEQNDN
jgi:molybdopterin/thiamine biosynthesis adenylyltransferase